ncbi:MAG: thiamine phosphate synthase [Polyangiales bacterium]
MTVWLRAPGVSGLRAYGAATVLRSLTHGFGGRLVVGDRLDLALACGADGVHLGGRSW